MKPKVEIEEILRKELDARKEIVFAYGFGSFIDGEQYRDIDLAVYAAPESLKSNPSIDFELGLKLAKEVGATVDVIVLNRAPDHLIHQISKGKLLLDRDLNLRADFISAAWIRYFDFQPKRKMYLEALAGR